MRMSVARMAVRISPPARRLPCTSIRFPTSLTRTPSSPLLSLRKQAWPVACRNCGFDQVSVQPELIAGVQNLAARTADVEERFRVGLHGL